MNRNKAIWSVAILAVVILAWAARWQAVALLPIDYDEDDYLSAAQHYAEPIRRGDWQAVIDYRFNYEHPPLSKLAYGFVLLGLPEATEIPEPTDPNIPPARSLPQPHFQNVRSFSAILGILEVLALAVVNPVAGFFLAINTWHTKYTAQIMLEALPALTSALTVIFYTAGKRKNQPGRIAGLNPWLVGSAVMLGLTASAKYMYCVVGLAILADWWLQQREAQGQMDRHAWRKWAPQVLAWGGLAILVFFATNPSLWNDPVGRLRESLLYHGAYAQSAHVSEARFPPWQPFVWLMMSVPWHPGVFLFSVDQYITVVALFGLRRLWERQRVFAIWLGMALVFLLLWPTKWPQYILTISAPLSLAAAYGLEIIALDPLVGFINRRRNPGAGESQKQLPPSGRQNLTALPWLLPGAIILTLITLFPLVYQLAMSLTDLSVMSLKDGLGGGIWREVWQGLSGQVEPVVMNVFQPQRSSEVRYAGFNLLQTIFFSGLSGLVAFEVLWTVLSVGLQLGLGLFVAMFLEKRDLHFKRWWRFVFILPWAIPEFAGALMWFQIYDPQFGLARQTAERLGAAAPGILTALVRWQDDPATTLLLMLVAATWYGFPFMMLAATAGLKMIPPVVYEAAAMDGATGWKLFRLITWPLLLPLLAPVIIIRAIYAFNQFYLFYVFQSQDTTTLSLLSFQLVRTGNYAISAGINIFIIAVLIVMILIFNRRSKAFEGVTYA